MLCALHLLLLQVAACAVHASAPHIVFILADDLGWNDVGFHGSNQFPTPNIDAISMSGQALHKYYVTPICTPSRAALMTGKYPIHTGMQHGVIYGAEPRGLPLSEKILPQYLKELGYKTHLVGKWHLGSYKREYLPLNRGFDSHLGFWTGKIDMYDHTTMEQGSWGFDFRRDFNLADNLFGKYVTDLYTDEAIRVISSHNKSQPLFLMMAHSAVHSGNPYEPLRAPEAIIDRFANINDTQRRKFAAMMWKLDESVGKVVDALQTNGLLRDTIIVFSTDNGGPAAGFNSNAASNYPLRGVKNTLWEGGIRGAGCVWSPRLRGGLVSHVPIHVADWLPTFYVAAGGNLSSLGDIDGLSQWGALSGNENPRRTSFIHNIDDIWGSSSISVGDWKIVNGTNYGGQWDNWYGPSGREGSYDVQAVLASPAAKAISQVAAVPNAEQIATMRAETTVQCDHGPAVACSPLQRPCLFNTTADPCEQRNLAESEPEVLQNLLQALELARRTAVPPTNKPMDARGDPRFWGRVYTNFGDYESSADVAARPKRLVH